VKFLVKQLKTVRVIKEQRMNNTQNYVYTVNRGGKRKTTMTIVYHFY